VSLSSTKLPLEASNRRSALPTSSSSRLTPSQFCIGPDRCALIIREFVRRCRYFSVHPEKSLSLQNASSPNRCQTLKLSAHHPSAGTDPYLGINYVEPVYAVEPPKSQSSSPTRFTSGLQTSLSTTISPLISFYDTISGGYAVRGPSILALPHLSVNS
jgi:hypothetical protein